MQRIGRISKIIKCFNWWKGRRIR